jgi:hypothetical protein
MADLPRDRKSLRWCIHDYRFDGWYFVTLCVQERLQLFG